MSYIDDLNEGEYIAVTSVNGEPRSKRGDHLDGHPFLIIAISLPFMVAEDMMGGRCSMDMRFIEVQKVSKQYADAHRPKRKRKQGLISGGIEVRGRPHHHDCRCMLKIPDPKKVQMEHPHPKSTDKKLSCPTCGKVLQKHSIVDNGSPPLYYCKRCNMTVEPY